MTETTLFYAIATPAAQASGRYVHEANYTGSVYSAVTDPAESGLVADNAAPGGNVTGAV